MEINYLDDLKSLRTAPQLKNNIVKKLQKELEMKILDADWITVGIMASNDSEAVDALRSITKKYSSIKFRDLDSINYCTIILQTK